MPSENLIRWIRSRKENRIMLETDGDLLQTSARIYVGLLPAAMTTTAQEVGPKSPHVQNLLSLVMAATSRRS